MSDTPKTITARLFVAGAILVALWFASRLGGAMGLPTEAALPAGRFEDLPTQLGAWIGDDVQMEARLTGVSTRYVQRLYRNPAQQSVLLYAALFTKYEIPVAPHSPESCYPAGGYQITGTTDVRIAADHDRPLLARLITVEGQGQRRHVLFWFQIPAATYLDGPEQRKLLWEYRGKEKLPAVIKVILESDADSEGSLDALKQIAPLVYSWVADYQNPS